MTPELYGELINFSFDSLQDAVKEYKKFTDGRTSTLDFSFPLIDCLKTLVRCHFYSYVFHIFII